MNDASDNVSKLFFISSDNPVQDFAARYEKLLLRKFVFVLLPGVKTAVSRGGWFGSSAKVIVLLTMLLFTFTVTFLYNEAVIGFN